MALVARESKQLLIHQLLSSDTIQGLVGDRIRTQHAMDADVEGVVYPCIILEALIGFGRYQAGFQTITYDIYCYSHISTDEAELVYDALFSRLHAARLVDKSGVIASTGGARELERPDDGWNEKTKSWWVRGKWLVSLARGGALDNGPFP